MKKIIIVLFALFLCGEISINAQSQDFGIWSTIGAKKKLSKKLTASGNVEMRTRDNVKSIDRWSGTLGMSYNIFRFLKVGGEYSYLYSHEPTQVTAKNNIIPDYWYSRHRATVSVTGSYKINKLTLSLRERWQYTYRPHKYVDKFDQDGVTSKEDELVKRQGKNTFRTRLQMDYEVFKGLLNPYASCEFYHGGNGLEKTRYTVGASIKATKHNEFDLFYRYQDMSDDDEVHGHILGIGYTYKF